MNYLLGLNSEYIENRIDDRLAGVGMIRSEYICRKIGKYFTEPSCLDYVANYIMHVCDIFSGSDVWYRTSDFIVQEVNTLVGADHVLYEHDYILGLRGVRRGLKYVSPFMDELKTVSQVSLTKCNLNLLFSYIKELEQCLRLLEKSNFQNKFGIMAEIPSTIICLEDFLRLGVSNVTVGINDLTTLLLGAYRTSEYYNCNHIAVYKAIEKIVNVCMKYKIPVSVGGVVNKEMLAFCQSIGVDNFIINYPLLPDILNIDPSDLEFLGEMEAIKKDTKSKRNKLEYQRMETILKRNGFI